MDRADHLLRSVAEEIIRWFDQHTAGQAANVVGGFIVEEGSTDMGEITVEATSEPISARVQYVDAEGKATTPDNVPTWSSSDEAVASITASEDGLSASIAIGGPGAAAIQVETDEDDGSGTITHLTASGLVTVVAGDAVAGEVTFEEPVAAPEEPPVEEQPVP